MTILRLVFLCLTIAAPAAPAFAADDAAALCTRLAANEYDPDFKGGPFVDAGKIDVAAAEPACRQAVKDHPDDRQLNYMLGRVLRQKGDFPAAIAQLETAEKKGSVIASVALGSIYEDGEGGTPQSFARAAEYYRKGVAGGYGYAATNLAYLHEYGWGVARDIAEAERLFRLAMTMKTPRVAPEAKNGLAWMLANENTRLAEAETLARAAVAEIGAEDDLSKASYLDTLALVRHRLGRDAEAVADAEAAIKLDQGSAGIYDRLGDIYAALGRNADAKATWEKALALDPPSATNEPGFSADAIKAKIAKLR